MTHGDKSLTNSIVIDYPLNIRYPNLGLYLEPVWDTITLTSMKLMFYFGNYDPQIISLWLSYCVEIKDPIAYHMFSNANEIQLVATDPIQYPLPSPTLLHIHCLLTRVCFSPGPESNSSDWYEDENELFLTIRRWIPVTG